MAAIKVPSRPVLESDLTSFSKHTLRNNPQDEVQDDEESDCDSNVEFEIMTGSKHHDKLNCEPAGSDRLLDTIDQDSMMPDFICVDDSSSGSLSGDGQSPNTAFEQPMLETPMVEPDLFEEQQDIVDLIASGHNVFYTGSAGCGRSTVLKAAVKRLEAMNKKVYVLAPTGRAALQIDGTTTWSYMGWTPENHKMPIERLIRTGWQKKVRTRFKETDVLIIDEISMVENHHLERINRTLKGVLSHKFSGEPPAFGGLQVVVTGDFCQLPPVKPFRHCIECGREMELDDEDASNCPENHGPFPEGDK
jgi:hypothetical protein